MAICASPKLIAACRVLHRRQMPRHPPCALVYFQLHLQSPAFTSRTFILTCRRFQHQEPKTALQCFTLKKLLESSLARCSGEDACISQGIWFDLERTLTARWRENSSTKKRAGRRTNGFSAKTALRSGCTQLRLATRGVSGCQLPRMLLRSSLERR
jgi:hypothetical protein